MGSLLGAEIHAPCEDARTPSIVACAGSYKRQAMAVMCPLFFGIPQGSSAEWQDQESRSGRHEAVRGSLARL